MSKIAEARIIPRAKINTFTVLYKILSERGLEC